MTPVENLVVPERRVRDRRSAWRNDASSFASGGESSRGDSDKVFPTTHARVRCEENLMEVQAAANLAHDVIQRSIEDAERILESLLLAMRAAKATQRAGHLAAGQISGAKSS